MDESIPATRAGRHTGRVGLGLLLAGLILAATASPVRGQSGDPSVVGSWDSPDLLDPAFGWSTHAIHRHTGDILWWRGSACSAALWNIQQGGLTPVPCAGPNTQLCGLDVTNPFCSGHVTLADATALVAGGHACPPDGCDPHPCPLAHARTAVFGESGPLSSGEFWTRKGDMANERWYATCTMLADSKILVCGGQRTGCEPVPVLEIYDPATGG